MTADPHLLLRSVERPSRYIGDEYGLGPLLPDPRLRVALAFPDVYEVGMSHLGFRLLHAGLLELREQGIQVERAFLPWPDMQARLRERSEPLCTLEGPTPLGEMDLLGLSVTYELAYPAVLKMLDLAGIPRLTRDRAARPGRWPLVLLGGAAALNPEPLAPFVDLVFLGEADHGLPELVQTLASLKDADRQEKLERLGALDGIYVPEWVEVSYKAGCLDLELSSSHPAHLPVTRRVVEDLDGLPVPPAHLVPGCALIHDRVIVEIQRGCSQGCRFCQAGYITRPTRQRSEEQVKELARRQLRQTGYQDLALLSLSAGDHPRLMPMLADLIAEHGPDNVGVSLPSLRTETLDPEVARQISKVRKTTFTLAPEAATDRLRRVINKQNTEQDLLDAVAAVVRSGYSRLKLYFMIGLPTETDEDLLAMAALADRVTERAKAVKKRAQVAVSVSTFVPKPHTAFQWEAAPTLEEIEHKLSLLQQAMPRKVRPFRWHDPGQSVVEAYLSRGDRRMAAVLARVVDQDHAGFDAWSEHFSMARWTRALEQALEAGEIPALHLYLEARPTEDTLPWDHLDFGIDRRYLAQERRAALEEQTREDCTQGECDRCGVCPDEPEHRLATAPRARPEEAETTAAEVASPEPIPPVSCKLRLWFRKVGRATLIGHLEMMVLFERAARRARLPLRHSQGFRPKAKIRFSPALPLGAESRCEFMEVTLRREMTPEELLEALSAQLPPGLEPVRAEPADPQVLDRIMGVQWLLTPDPPIEAERVERAAARLKEGPLEIVRGKKKRARDLTQVIQEISPMPDGVVRVTCAFGPQGTVKPEEILRHLLELTDEEIANCHVIRESWELSTVDC